MRGYQVALLNSAQWLLSAVGATSDIWDNLTNKAMNKVVTARVLVWNEMGRTEETEQHGIAGGNVGATGGTHFEEWFDSKPDTFFFSSGRRHTRWTGDWSSDVCSSD